MAVSSLIKNLGGFFAVVSLAMAVAGCATTPASDTRADSIILSLHQAAQSAEAENNYQGAASHYRNISGRQPDNLAFVLGLARNLRYSGNAKEALKTLESRRKIFTATPAFLLELGKTKLAAGNAQAAIDTLKSITGKGEENWQTYASLGIAYDLLQSPGQAWRAYKQALRLSPGNPAVINNMALSAAIDGKIELAISTLEGAGYETRKSPQIRQNLALFYAVKGDMKTAETIAKIDLDEKSLRHNLDIFSRFHDKTSKH